MNKIVFETEENINFYDLLNQDNNENIIIDNNSSNHEDNMCLLTKEPLTLNYVTLPACKHKFNYLPLLKELLRQKNYKTNDSHNSNLNLSHYYYKDTTPNGYSKCPYCRKLSSGCLPYISELFAPKYHDVNSPSYKAFNTIFCKHIIIYGKRKGQECGKLAYETSKDIFTCKSHKIKIKTNKQESIKVKNKIKELDTNHNNVENLIISNEIINGCEVLLKTGPRKGKICGAKVVNDTNICLRHTNLASKKLENQS